VISCFQKSLFTFSLYRYSVVRICMCNQLAAISRAIGPDATEKLVLPEAGLSVQVKSS
jgi:hypothetical protein